MFDSPYFVHQAMEMHRAFYHININTKAFTLTLLKNNMVYKTYRIAIGKARTPTPLGNFKIMNKAPNPGGPYGALWLGLNVPNGGYGIHGTNNPSSIGKNVSHGCIRMQNHDVVELGGLVPIGTTVSIE